MWSATTQFFFIQLNDSPFSFPSPPTFLTSTLVCSSAVFQQTHRKDTPNKQACLSHIHFCLQHYTIFLTVSICSAVRGKTSLFAAPVAESSINTSLVSFCVMVLCHNVAGMLYTFPGFISTVLKVSSAFLFVGKQQRTTTGQQHQTTHPFRYDVPHSPNR